MYNPKTTEFKITKNNYQDGWQTCGPLWVGDLQDKKLVQRMEKINKFPEEKQFLNTIKHELDIVGYYDVNTELSYDIWSPGRLPVSVLDIKYDSDEDPFQLVYTSPSFNEKLNKPFTTVFVYKINQNYIVEN